MQSPDDEVVWDLSRQDHDSGIVQISLEQDGRYVLRLRGEDTAGGWDLKWNIE